jgi:hypothetical protein
MMFFLENSRSLKPGRARKWISLDPHSEVSHDSDRCEVVVSGSGHYSAQFQDIECAPASSSSVEAQLFHRFRGLGLKPVLRIFQKTKEADGKKV